MPVALPAPVAGLGRPSSLRGIGSHRQRVGYGGASRPDMFGRMIRGVKMNLMEKIIKLPNWQQVCMAAPYIERYYNFPAFVSKKEKTPAWHHSKSYIEPRRAALRCNILLTRW